MIKDEIKTFDHCPDTGYIESNILQVAELLSSIAALLRLSFVKKTEERRKALDILSFIMKNIRNIIV